MNGWCLADRRSNALRRFATLGIGSVFGPVPAADRLTPLHLHGKHAIPAVARF
jgi:hypothetical protein